QHLVPSILGDRSDLLVADATGLIDEIGFRRSGDAEIDGRPTRAIGAYEAIGIAIRLQQVGGRDRIVLPGDAVDRKASLGLGYQKRMLHFAGHAPGGEDIHERDLAVKIGGGKALVAAGDRRQIDGGERPVDEHRWQLVRIAPEPNEEVNGEYADNEHRNEIGKAVHDWRDHIVWVSMTHRQMVAEAAASSA